MTEKQLNTYLEFLDLEGVARSPNLALLTKLQWQHMLSVPFENFDVYLKRPLSLDVNGIFEKVVTNKRGGYCFELNNLFGHLLTTLGFSVRGVMARVWLRDPPEVPPRSHLANLVNIDGEDYLIDVGFGGNTSRMPLKIDKPAPVDDGEGLIKVEKIGSDEYMLSRRTSEGDWLKQYTFEDRPVFPSDLKTANFFMECHPDSHFVPNRFIGLFTEQGRKGLFENQFSERVGQKVIRQEEIANGAAWLTCLREEFGMEFNLTEAELERLAGGLN